MRHPIFARVYSRLARALESKGTADHRAETLLGLVGRVVEVGAGNGLNLKHYPPTVTKVVAVEPEAYLRARAEEAAKRSKTSIEVLSGTAEQLPLADESVDAGVISLVMCSVNDPSAALAELRRVIRPDGELRFYEHVVASNPRLARSQNRWAKTWSRFAGGCHPNRDTAMAIRTAGFEIEAYREFRFAPSFAAKLVAPHIIGRARR